MTERKKLLNRGFVSLLVTQFLGASNDNILKQVLIFMVISGIWANKLGGEGGQGYVSLCLTLPFILLSGYAGQIADRVSKHRVAITAKIAEIPIAMLAGIGLWTGTLWLTLVAFVMLAIQSTFFGPAKYGIIPELVPGDELSRANGAINMLTNIAIIVGSMIAGPICVLYFPKPDETGVIADAIRWLPGVLLLAVAIAGLSAALFLPRLEAKAPKLRFDWNPIRTYITGLREMSRGPLIWIAIAWAYFYMMGMIAILVLPEYVTLFTPVISYTKAGYLLGVLGMSVAAGSITAGYISGHHIEPRLIPIGALGMAFFFALLGFVDPNYTSNPAINYWSVAIFIGGVGFFAGFYEIPLQAALQDLSPEAERGRFLGTTNALSSVFSSAGALMCWYARGRLGIPANRVFLICAVLALIATILIVWRLRHIPRRDQAEAQQ